MSTKLSSIHMQTVSSSLRYQFEARVAFTQLADSSRARQALGPRAGVPNAHGHDM